MDHSGEPTGHSSGFEHCVSSVLQSLRPVLLGAVINDYLNTMNGRALRVQSSVVQGAQLTVTQVTACRPALPPGELLAGPGERVWPGNSSSLHIQMALELQINTNRER